jgi:hypothetical protein
MAQPDPRIPEAVRNAQLVGLRLVDAATADWALDAYAATLPQPVRPASASDPKFGLTDAQIVRISVLIRTYGYSREEALRLVQGVGS